LALGFFQEPFFTKVKFICILRGKPELSRTGLNARFKKMKKRS